MTIAPIQGPLTPQVTIPVTPVRPVIPVTPPAAPSVEINSGQVQAQIVAKAAQEAAGRQGGLAPLVADLSQAVRNPMLPTPVRSAAAQVLAQARPSDGRIGGADIAKAFAQSGLFLEARLASEPRVSPRGQDLKAELLVLRQALAVWLAGAPRVLPRTTGRTPPPPYRGAGASTQPAASPSLPSDAPPSAVGQRLLAETEAAVARQELLQIASMPAGTDEPLEAQLVTRWMFEMPFTTPQGAAVAQFEIGRDLRGAQPGGEPAWRVAFSLDIEPLGPIHARISLRGVQATVGLWAERDVALEHLRQGQHLLAEALRRAELSAEIAIQPGAPPMRAPEAGRLVDQTS